MGLLICLILKGMNKNAPAEKENGMDKANV